MFVGALAAPATADDFGEPPRCGHGYAMLVNMMPAWAHPRKALRELRARLGHTGGAHLPYPFSAKSRVKISPSEVSAIGSPKIVA